MVNPLAALVTQIRAGDVVLAVALLLLAVWIGSRLAEAILRVPRRGRLDVAARLAAQFGVLLGLEQAYEFTRGLITHGNTTDLAFLHAYQVFDFELRHGLFIEQRLQRMVLGWGPVMAAVDYFYVFAHVVVTVGVLLWVYIRHRDRYPFVRNLLMVTTGIALVVFYLYPTAPPRFLTGYGFVDPATANRLVEAGGAQPSSYTYNPYAAMPSLHVGYAIVVAWAVLLCTRRRAIRLAALAYPPVMSFVVIASANHWVLDVAGSLVTVAGAAAILRGWRAFAGGRQRRSWRRARAGMAARESAPPVSAS